MKILFINVTDDKIPTELTCPAMGTLYLASYLEKNGYSDIRVLQTGHVDENTINFIKPDIIGVSSVTQNFGLAQGICRDIKSCSDIPIIVGGIHISTLPQCLSKDMDIGVIGEGEQTMLELAKACESGGSFHDIKGIVYHDGDQLKQTQRRELIQPLNNIPPPARHLVEILPFQQIIMMTSRGCPFICSFCSPSAMWRSVRYFSPERVVAEMEEIYKEYRHAFIWIGDDLFTVNKPRLRAIVDLAKKLPFYGNVQFMCLGRADVMDDETAKLLRSLGVSCCSMGLESGNQRILNYLKPGATVSANMKAVNTLADNGIEPLASFIIGSPTETKEEMLNTLDFIKSSRLAYFSINSLVPYPGTQVWQEAKEMGVVSDNMSWDAFRGEQDESPAERLVVTKMPRQELLRIFPLFIAERKRRMLKRNIKAAMRHPDRLYGHLKSKRQLRAFLKEKRD